MGAFNTYSVKNTWYDLVVMDGTIKAAQAGIQYFTSLRKIVHI